MKSKAPSGQIRKIIAACTKGLRSMSTTYCGLLLSGEPKLSANNSAYFALLAFRHVQFATHLLLKYGGQVRPVVLKETQSSKQWA
jgi:hypothetical protein